MALKWSQLEKIGYNSVSLSIEQTFDLNLKKIGPVTEEQNRIIVIPSILGQALYTFKDHIPASRELIFFENGADGKELQQFYDHIKKQEKYLFKEIAGIPDIRLVDPKSGKEISLKDYSRDLFRANYKFQMKATCGLTQGEINHQLGLKQKTTADIHYIGYDSVPVLLIIATKLKRWEQRYIPQFIGKNISSHYSFQFSNSYEILQKFDFTEKTIGKIHVKSPQAFHIRIIKN